MIEGEDGSGEGETLGPCPICDAAIPSARLLIRYESEEGGIRMFAECPRCEVPVHPGAKGVQRHASSES